MQATQAIRDTRADFIKVVATIMVVMIHIVAMDVITKEPGDIEWIWANYLDVFCRVAPPLFFMISGAFLLAKNAPIGDFFKKRASRLLLPVFFWTMVYLVVRLYLGTYELKSAQLAKDIFFGDLYYHLWFVNAIVMIYLITPFFRKFFIASSISVKIATTASLFAVSWICQANSILPGYFTNLLAYFGYFLFGNIAWNFLGSKNRLFLFFGLLVFIASSTYTAYNTQLLSVIKGEFVGELYGYATVGIFLASASIFVALLQYQPSQKLNSMLSNISACGLGIYLSHPLVLKIMQAEKMDMGYPLGAVGLTSAAFLVSFGVIYLMKKSTILARLV